MIKASQEPFIRNFKFGLHIIDSSNDRKVNIVISSLIIGTDGRRYDMANCKALVDISMSSNR